MQSDRGDEPNSNRIYFVGAGPGDPELLTLKARRLLDRADVIVYTGSLVPKAVLKGCSARQYDSAGMHLDQVMDLLIDSYEQGLRVVRLHTGDPSLYSAIAEQIERLRKKSIPFEVVPGVTSGFAACASLGAELTLPERVQTVIISRIAGRTPVPENESLDRLARIGCSLILYLSVGHMDEVVKHLRKGYSGDTPVAVVEKASWPEERIVLGTISDIAEKVEEAGIRKTAVIIVGKALEGLDSETAPLSRLYSRDFSHGYRKADTVDCRIIQTFSQARPQDMERPLIVYLGDKGKAVAQRINSSVEQPFRLIRYSKLKEEGILERDWNRLPAIVFVSACQIAVRTIAPFIKDKYTDPAVVAVDESGENAVCLLSGHLGGGNELASRLSKVLKARPVITTQSDLLDLPALDLWARAQNLVPSEPAKLKKVQARFRDGIVLKVFVQRHVKVHGLPRGLRICRAENEADIVIGPFIPGSRFQGLHLLTRNLCIGTGCHKGLEPERLIDRLKLFSERHSVHPCSIGKVCTIDKKAKEPAIVGLASYLQAELITFSAETLNSVPDIETSRAVLEAVGAKAVAEPSALLCCSGGRPIVRKERFDCCTFSLAANDVDITERY